MDQELVTSLAEEMKVSESLADLAVLQAGGELAKAREILGGLVSKYLVIKAQFLTRRAEGIGGLIFVVMERNATEFAIFRTVAGVDRDWVGFVSVQASPVEFYKIIKDYFQQHTSGMHVFDAQRLKDGMSARLTVSELQNIFNMHDSAGGDSESPRAAIRLLVEAALGDAIADRVALKTEHEFYPEVQFSLMREGLGLVVPQKGTVAGEKAAEVRQQQALDVHLKGRFAIDPVEGKMVHELAPGEYVYCEIVDRTDTAVAVGRMVGAYNNGLWLPVGGLVEDVQDAAGQRRKFSVKIGTGVFVDVLSYKDIKVRVSTRVSVEDEPEEPEVNKAAKPEASMVPLIIAVSLVAFLILVLMLMR